MAVEDIQEVYTAALQAYVDARRRATARPVLAEILLALSELRKIAAELVSTLQFQRVDLLGTIDNFPVSLLCPRFADHKRVLA